MSLQPPQRPRLTMSSSNLPISSSNSPGPSSAEGNVSPLLPAFVPPALHPSMSRQSTAHSISLSQHRAAFLTPSMPTAHDVPACGRILLMPTVRQARTGTSIWPASRMPSVKSSPAKMSRSRAGSVVASLQPSPDLSATPTDTVDWIGGGCRFEVVEDQIHLEGYQIYAVEKW